MIKTIVLLAVAGIAGVLLIAATRPSTFRVERSADIQAPPERIHALINDMHQFNIWNPYAKKDPAMKGTYRGPASGPGAAFDFHGNKDVGKGSIAIVDTRPDLLTMKLDMIEPFEGHNTVEFKLVPQGATTSVTWAMHGPAPYLSRVIGLFLNMDSMIGRDFESGLAGLKVLAERK